MAVGGVNGDGKLDLVVIGSISFTTTTIVGYDDYGNPEYEVVGGRYVNVLLGQGDGTFATRSTQLVPSSSPALALGDPHLQFKRWPRYRPQLDPMERFGKKRRSRATHNRPFDRWVDLKASRRASVCSVQTMRRKVKSLVDGPPKRKTAK